MGDLLCWVRKVNVVASWFINDPVVVVVLRG